MAKRWRALSASRYYLLLLAAACAIGAGAAGVGAEDLAPLARVKQAVGRVLEILNEKDSVREDRWQRIAAVIEANFDFRSMSQSVLSTQWKRASLEERRQFTDYFAQYIETTFRERIEAYTGQRIEFLGQKVRGDRAIVNTIVVSGRIRTPVTYKLRQDPESSQWLAYDVVIEGISLIANYRTTFAAIAKSAGMSGLIADVQDRIARHESGAR